MKLTIKLNIEEFQNVDFETNEYGNIASCYAEVSDFLGDWVEYTANAVKLKAHIEALGIVAVLKEEGEIKPLLSKKSPNVSVSSDLTDSKPLVEDQAATYKVAGKPCRECGGFISWDLRPDRNLPLHVNQEGRIVNDGNCPNYEGG